MPTQHIEPACAELLQDVANSLLKSRKVVVVTGAGISTNSGIPDFRSENGLYSLIQAQFDAANRQPFEDRVDSKDESTEEESDADEDEDEREDGPPAKRLKTSNTDAVEDAQEECDEIEVSLKVETVHETTLTTELDQASVEETSITVESSSIAFSTPRPRRTALSLGQLMTSPLSSPPAEDQIIPPSVFRSSRLSKMAIPFSSSPLSSPPPNLFDPFCPSSPSDDGSSRRSSTSPSEVDDTPTSSLNPNPFSASQSSASGKLPNMKGKDLFDASIWSDPLRTSVFYTFATTLRKKIRDVEPTSSHRFISHLRDRGKLVRCYTQNIDQIEEMVGLSTNLHHGPGSRGRFSRRSTATSQLSKMVEELSGEQAAENSESQSSSQTGEESTENSTIVVSSQDKPSEEPNKSLRRVKAELPKSGVECVFLHGSLEQLRCFLCGRVCSWDDDQREWETMCGQQPECPHCAGATAAREERGKRALGVGKLRPDIVLYGEEHPNAHLISPIITHDLGLSPDLLLILGTSLRVHGLKIMVREFAKAVHAKGGKVVFVNFTKPPESIWGDVIDYWVQWDCDAWVSDLQDRIPKMWAPPEPPKIKKKRNSGAATEDGPSKPEIKKPPPANPVAIRDTKITGAYQTLKIVDELHRITGEPERPRRASLSMAKVKEEAKSCDVVQEAGEKPARKPRARGPRRSAPGNLERPKKLASSTLNPDHGRPQRTNSDDTATQDPATMSTPKGKDVAGLGTDTADAADDMHSSILDSVKRNARTRKRKKIDGVEVVMPTVGRRKTSTPVKVSVTEDLKLPPMNTDRTWQDRKPGDKLETLEPKSPPPGPLASISPNMRSARRFGIPNSFYMQDALINHGPTKPTEYPKQDQENILKPGPRLSRSSSRQRGQGRKRADAMDAGEPQKEDAVTRSSRLASAQREGVTTRATQQLARWGSSWNCVKP